MNSSNPNRKRNIFLIILGIFIAITIIDACRKVDRQSETVNQKELEFKFFKKNQSNVPLVAELNKFLQGENNKYHFLEKMVRQIGFPYWDKSKTISNNGHWGRGSGINEDSVNITYIPFVRDSQNYVNTLLLIKTSDTDTAFQFLCDWQYANFGFDTTIANWDAKDVFHIFSIFDKEAFGRTKFIITDRRIMGTVSTDSVKVEMLEEGSTGSARASIFSPVTICTPYRECCTCGCLAFRNSSGPDVCCYPEYGTACTTFWVEDGWVPVSGGNGGGGGTGGGGNWNPPPCYENCTPGWQPGASPTLNQMLQAWDDSIIINYTVRPCVDTIINKMKQIDSGYIAFVINRLSGQIPGFDWEIAEQSSFSPPFDTASGLTQYNHSLGLATTFLNRAKLQNATNLLIAQVLIHESIHAFLFNYF